MNEYTLFSGRIKTDESLALMDEIMVISTERKWNMYFAFPDLESYNGILKRETIEWAGILHRLLQGTESE